MRTGTGPLTKLEHAQAWFVRVPAGTKAGKIWGRTGCHFAGEHCQEHGQAPATVAEFTISGDGDESSGADSFAVSVADGFNLPLDFACGGGNPRVCKEWVWCREPGCPDAMKVRRCRADGDYNVVFCPFKD